ncbi:MAG: hypothetical protein LC733_09975, partial [Actinobacteria bacterium]|nr:hypothetical protein [Actinomycetota bacterium]
AFVILYLFPDRTQKLWGWTIRLSMSALIMGGGYLAGAYFFTRVVRSREWHRVGVGFPAITVFSSVLMVATVLHWERFNHDHVSFWAWLLLYASTPLLLPLLWANNRRTDPGTPSPSGDVRIPRPVRIAVGVGGAAQLAFAAFMFGWPDVVARSWPWPVDAATARSISAFVAFPAVTWLWFLLDERWSSFRITQQTATLGLVLVGVGALRARDDFRSDGRFWTYLVTVVVTIALNVALYWAMERRAHRDSMPAPAGSQPDRVPAR